MTLFSDTNTDITQAPAPEDKKPSIESIQDNMIPKMKKPVYDPRIGEPPSPNNFSIH